MGGGDAMPSPGPPELGPPSAIRVKALYAFSSLRKQERPTHRYPFSFCSFMFPPIPPSS